MPDRFPFCTTVRIRITDLNYGNHVGNDTFLSLAHEARQQFLKHHGYAELEFAGVGLIMADAMIEFRAELSFGDEVQISVAATEFSSRGFNLYYQLDVLQPDGTKKLAAKIKTGMLCYDYSLGKVVSVPAGVAAALS